MCNGRVRVASRRGPETSSAPNSCGERHRNTLITGGKALLVSQLLPLASKAASTTSQSQVQVVAETTANTFATGQENSFVSGLASGIVSRVNKEILLHPIDTVRARLQTKSRTEPEDSIFTISTEKINRNQTGLYDGLYSGIVPALIGGVPAGALFFGVKDYSKSFFRKAGFDRSTATILSVVVTNVPYWIVRSPAEVLKTRRQAGVDVSALSTLQELWEEDGISSLSRGLYGNYPSNYAYATPADIVKFLAYESITSNLYGLKEGQKVKGVNAAVAGALAGLVSQITTTPLDVARTRIMTGETEGNSIQVMQQLAHEEGLSSLFSGLSPRIARAIASGIIQFVSIEYTLDLFRK